MAMKIFIQTFEPAYMISYFSLLMACKIDLTSQIELVSCPCIHLPVISNIDKNSFLRLQFL